MNHLALALRESHTRIVDPLVNAQTLPRAGVPLMFSGGGGAATRRFGACLTLLPDDSLLVYRAVPGHPLGLVPGDRILGYDGRPWRELYGELLEAELPLTGGYASSPVGFDHSFMVAAGQNWHLFDSMDVVKHGSGETLHLPTAPLDAGFDPLFCSEQLDVPGVPPPAFILTDLVRWGVVENTRIGYIYVFAWDEDAEFEFWHAVKSLTIDRPTAGLIIDFRTNFGGNMFMSNSGLNLLFRDPTPTIAFAERGDPADHLSMVQSPTGLPGAYVINSVPDPDFYDRPIAVLTGPGAVSSGDQVALRMTFHPTARTFGKTTAAAFNGPSVVALPNLGWVAAFASADAFRLTDPTNFLTHDEFPVDFPVWLTPEDVAAGKDTVVEKALRWIQNRAPSAAIESLGEVECSSPAGALVRLDGSASSDGITQFEWIEDLGTPSETLLGRGEILDVQLPLGDHRVALRVTDEFGLQDTTDTEVRVTDTTPPWMEVTATPSVLWPPDHRLADVRALVSASDLCGPVTTVLVSIQVDEPEGVDDIQDAATGQPDFEFRLGAERSIGGDGRVYTVTYMVTDASGNHVTSETPIVVPHDKGLPARAR
jgi:hypothetical protein